MILTEEEAVELKSWVVKKLEDISDADSDVLADYVLALIRADTPEPELRLNAIENLEDFLKDNTATFVDAIFRAIHSKSYLPGQISQPTTLAVGPSFAESSASASSYPQNVPTNGVYGDVGQSRKRSFKDRSDDTGLGDSHYGRGDRQMKQMRRGGNRNGRADALSGRGGRGGFQPSTTSKVSQGTSPSFPTLQMPPPGLPFDPNDPIAAIMTMQAMGLPPFPGMPSLPQSTSTTSLDHFGTQHSPMPEIQNQLTTNVRCRDYDTKGYCTRGNSCPFVHGNDHMIAPGQDEYDPKNSVMMDISKISTVSNGSDHFDGLRSNGVIRTIPKGRGDRNSHVHSRRNRAEFSYNGPNHDTSLTTIVVEQIPEDCFDEQSVRDFFSVFGNIDEVTMQAYKRLALVKYRDYMSARSAYESPKVIFDNRFVKVYWYKPENGSGLPTNNTPKDSLGSSKAEQQPYDKGKYEEKAIAAQKKLDEKRKLQRDTEAKRQALEKQKEELARRQTDETKKLLKKLAAKGRSEDTSSNPGAGIPDHSMDSVNGRDDGKVSAQTKALRAQVAALEAEAKSLGLDPALTEDPWTPRGRGRGRGRGSYRGWEGFAGRGSNFDSSRGSVRGRGAFRGGRSGGAYNLDNRTRKVGISGVELDAGKDEALRQYLLGVGEFEAIEFMPDRTNMQVVIFKDRFTAEQFMYSSKDIPGVGKVELSWVNTPFAPPRPNPKQLALNGGDIGMGDASADGDNGDKGVADVDYDVAEEDDRWMVE